jgi:hypothetical protein
MIRLFHRISYVKYAIPSILSISSRERLFMILDRDKPIELMISTKDNETDKIVMFYRMTKIESDYHITEVKKLQTEFNGLRDQQQRHFLK